MNTYLLHYPLPIPYYPHPLPIILLWQEYNLKNYIIYYWWVITNSYHFISRFNVDISFDINLRIISPILS
jgi:hypothetical protein